MKKVVTFENFGDLKNTKKLDAQRKYSQEELDEWREWAEKWVENKLPETDKG